jgi:hypothetical protein
MWVEAGRHKMKMTTIREFAREVRSKNAGPFWLTLEIFLRNKEDHDKLVALEVVTPELISKLYGTPADQVQIFFCENISTIKISIPRPAIQGSPQDKDVHAGQQSVFLANVEIEV